MIDRQSLLIIGAMKSGTTSLAETLELTTNIRFPCGKEPNVFSQSQQVFTDRASDYIEKMKSASESHIIADASPQYTFRDDESATRAHSIHGKNTCVVYILRDPISRAWSHFQHAWHRGWKMASTPDEAFDKEVMLFQASDYVSHLLRWRSFFPRFLTIRFEDYIEDANYSIKEIANETGASVVSKHITSQFSNPASFQGNFTVPGKLQSIVRSAKYIPGGRQILRSPFVVRLRAFATYQEVVPRPSKDCLLRFHDRIFPRCEMLYQELGWRESQRWDLEKSIERISCAK